MLCANPGEPNFILFLHMVIHLLLISNVLHEMYHEYWHSQEKNFNRREFKYDLRMFSGVYILVKLRVFIYFVVLVATIL